MSLGENKQRYLSFSGFRDFKRFYGLTDFSLSCKNTETSLSFIQKDDNTSPLKDKHFTRNNKNKFIDIFEYNGTFSWFSSQNYINIKTFPKVFGK